MLIKTKTDGLFKTHRIRKKKTFVSELMPDGQYKFPGFFACYPMTKEPGGAFSVYTSYCCSDKYMLILLWSWLAVSSAEYTPPMYALSAALIMPAALPLSETHFDVL